MSIFVKLPTTAAAVIDWTWDDFVPYIDELRGRELTTETVQQFLTDRARLLNVAAEIVNRLEVATTLNTKDEAAQQKFLAFLGETIEELEVADQDFKQKLLASGLEPANYTIQMRNLRQEAALFRLENVPLETKEEALNQQYNSIIGGQTVEWCGETKTLAQMRPAMIGEDRGVREEAWRLVRGRQLADRAKLNDLWKELLTLRRQIAANADEPEYRSYKWKELLRFDYTPDDCLRFHSAIEQIVVPAANRLYEKAAAQLGLTSLRPWDLDVDTFVLHHPPLVPFSDPTDLDRVTGRIFDQVDPELGAYYRTMQEEKLLDLVNYEGKGPGGYCTIFPLSKRPFIFMNAVGLHDDVQTLLHEGGHAFHVFAEAVLPDYQLVDPPMEFAEVASMAMELLAAPYLSSQYGGFYDDRSAAKAHQQHLQHNILFWPYMAVVDAFQHWVYTHADAALNPDNCDDVWAREWKRFLPAVDFSGLEAELVTGWQRKLHIFQLPFYYVEYGLAQLGATQIWGNALRDQVGAVKNYREALALGGFAHFVDTLDHWHRAWGTPAAPAASRTRRVLPIPVSPPMSNIPPAPSAATTRKRKAGAITATTGWSDSTERWSGADPSPRQEQACSASTPTRVSAGSTTAAARSCSRSSRPRS